jgi:hypothetical protein
MKRSHETGITPNDRENRPDGSAAEPSIFQFNLRADKIRVERGAYDQCKVIAEQLQREHIAVRNDLKTKASTVQKRDDCHFRVNRDSGSMIGV